MRKILLLGAGRSASSLIRYLLEHAENESWSLTVGDLSPELALQKTAGHPRSRAIAFDVNNEDQRRKEVTDADIVISMLPPALHSIIANDCVSLKKNMVTASYISKEIESLHGEAKKNGVLLLNEIGLDPGIDHLSAMQVIHRLKDAGAEITSFKSYCGGLVAPESNDNPWGYKFSWNPRNVVLAGQSTARYLDKGKLHFIPYSRIFTDIETIQVKGYGEFDGYANRDSLHYIKPYGIDTAQTVLRGTLREKSFCKKWNCLAALGLTDDSFTVEHAGKLSYREFTESFLPSRYRNFEEYLAGTFQIDTGSEAYKALEWLGIVSDEKIAVERGTPAQVLQDLLERKWKLKEHDKDMIVMQHQFEYRLGTKKSLLQSSLVVMGDDPVQTAMAKTVGLPMAIAAKLILNDKIRAKGVVMPLEKEFYEPILRELQELGIVFHEEEN